jgi:acetoin utilization deacetylase AcuC-like enzyme
VASGALHALSDAAHRPRCERIAIVDIDVHHGNGTEEIVLKSQDPGRLLFFSVHLYDNEKKKGNGYSFYPGTGDEDDVARNIINVPLAPMWKEKDISASRAPIPLRSQHMTRNKVKQKSTSASSSKPSSPRDTSQDEASDSGRSVLESDSSSRKGNSGPPTPNHYMMGFGRQAYRRAIQHRLLPALRAFNPDLIMMSVGFDAAKGDVGNAKHFSMGKEQMGIDLEPEDYAWTTRKVLEVADICCQGKVVSVLEGGYGRTPGPPPQASSADTTSARAHEALDKSCFSECAMRHLQALIDPYDAEMRHPIKE